MSRFASRLIAFLTIFFCMLITGAPFLWALASGFIMVWIGGDTLMKLTNREKPKKNA